MKANGDKDEIVQLAERLLARPHPLGGYPTVELLPGRIPDDAGIELVVPSGGRLLGSALERRDGTLSAIQAIIEVDQPPAAALSAYGAALQSKGWTRPDFGGGEGFVSSRGGPPRMYRKGEDGPLLMIHATARDSGTTELHLRLDFTAPGWSGYPPGRHGRPEAMELLPALYPPDGVGMEGGGGGGSDASWSSHATATTTMPVAELESFFAAQLARDGWTRLAGESGDATAWSSWKVGAKGDWRAILIVLASPEDDERWMTVHMQRRSHRGGGWASAVSGLTSHR